MITVPCGKCNLCLKKRANEWFLRLRYELKTATSAYFVTLTYEDTPRTFNGLKTTKKSDLQDYFKRLRKRESVVKINPKTGRNIRVYNKAIKYYACSEYGEETHRPHYHAIIFNVSDENNLYRSWSVDGNYKGFVTVSPITDARMRYVTGYIEKRVGIGQIDYDDRQKEFSLMSKNLGIHYAKIGKLFHSTTLQGYTQLEKRKFSLPRYYKDKMFPDDKKTFHTYKVNHDQTISEHSFTITTKNPIKQKISTLNYENFIKSKNQLIKNFGSIENFEKNRRSIAERDNTAQFELLIKSPKITVK